MPDRFLPLALHFRPGLLLLLQLHSLLLLLLILRRRMMRMMMMMMMVMRRLLQEMRTTRLRRTILRMRSDFPFIDDVKKGERYL